MSSTTVFGLVIPYLPFESLVSLLHSHKFDPDHEVIIRNLRNHCIFRYRYIPENCNYNAFYNYIKYYYLISRFHCIDPTKRAFTIQFYLNNNVSSNNKLEDPRGCRPSNSHHFYENYYCLIDGYWKWGENPHLQPIPDKPWDWGLESVQQILVVPFTRSLDHIVQKECQLLNISSSKYFRSQNLNHQNGLRKHFNRKQFNRKQFNRKQFNRKQFNRKR